MWAVIGVLTGPGLMVITLTPAGARWLRKPCRKMLRPPLAAPHDPVSKLASSRMESIANVAMRIASRASEQNKDKAADCNCSALNFDAGDKGRGGAPPLTKVKAH